MNQFKPDDLAVYPNYGVGKVVSVESRMMGDSEVSCYVVNILADSSKVVIVPVDSAEQMGLRSLIDIKDVEGVYGCFKYKNILGIVEKSFLAVAQPFFLFEEHKIRYYCRDIGNFAGFHLILKRSVTPVPVHLQKVEILVFEAAVYAFDILNVY